MIGNAITGKEREKTPITTTGNNMKAVPMK